MKPILFIAPYLNMAENAQRLSEKIGVPMYIEVGNNQAARAIAKKYPEVDVIISRGGTANDLKSLPEVTVVEIRLSITDLFQAAHSLLLQGFRTIGVATTANIFDEKARELTLGDAKFFISPCVDDDAIRDSVRLLCQEGVDALIGCRVATDTARSLGLPAAFLESSEVSLTRAIDEAVKIVRAKEIDRLRWAQLDAIINNIEEGVLAVSGDNQISFFNQRAAGILAPDKEPIRYEAVKELMQHHKGERIITYKNEKLLARSTPLMIENAYKGDVLIFQEVSTIQNSERKIRMSQYQKGLYAKKKFIDIIAKSEAMRHLLDKARKYARYDANILIGGETGTGKEILTQSIHNESQRQKGPFVSVNCAAIPASIMESELFGYVEGAFTGARKGGKPGLFELAHGGTIFLDEIGEIPLPIQTRLLRVLQEREIMRIGDDKIIPVDIRIICATNKDLGSLVDAERFREDLYYRINVLSLRIPSLRERCEDIPLLLRHYLNAKQKKYGVTVDISPEAMALLVDYRWPGNIRQLMNVTEVLSLSEELVIQASHVGEILSATRGSRANHAECGHSGRIGYFHL